MHTRHLTAFEQSLFWARLEEHANAPNRGDVDHLRASVRAVDNLAKWITTQICRYMPQYTLHEERHCLNVLSIMETLVPESTMQRLTPLECALPILAAYTHDLGMALSTDEYRLLQDSATSHGKHFASYRARFEEEVRQIRRWEKRYGECRGISNSERGNARAEARERIDAIEGHILASYIRDTHTENTQIRRLRHWLEAIRNETGDARLFQYGDFPFQRELALIGTSHGRGVSWLRQRLVENGPPGSFYRPVAVGEWANLAIPGLLLRLADVMDFDSSRAPRILFSHFGIEDDRSVLEWRKHLSITGWDLLVDAKGKEPPHLIYTSHNCQHPVHERTIREFAGWIDEELSAVRVELDAQRRQLPAPDQNRYDLQLPGQTSLDIRPARDPVTDQPKYVYHDLKFRLDQDEMQALLMGESLYGDPGLCIRELLQNALDALSLRELRLKLKQRGQVFEPVDGELIRPGWVREPDGNEEQLHVRLEWGTDPETGQQWLRVTDNGTGMTEEVIKTYFAQVGKSYYRSPDFRQEQASIRAAGESFSPSSIFGIGILSCFMLSDRIQVRTRPGDANDADRQALDIHISGPGSLFWVRPGRAIRQGTEITLFLKSRFVLQHDADGFLDRLRKHFRYGRDADKYDGYWKEDLDEIHRFRTTEDEDQSIVGPAIVAASSAVWPAYPIEICPPRGSSVVIDDQFHSEVLAPIDTDQLMRSAAKWSCPTEFLGEPSWEFFDWRDDAPAEGTGTRIRLWYPVAHRARFRTAAPFQSPGSSRECQTDELAAFTESQLEGQEWSHKDWTPRVLFLVRGMHVRNVAICDEILRCVPLVGTRIWIDLRGAAAPELTADRRTAYQRQRRTEWRRIGREVFDRFQCSVLRRVTTSQQLRSLFLCFAFPGTVRLQSQNDTPEVNLLDFPRPSWDMNRRGELTPSAWRAARLLQLRARYQALVSAFYLLDELDYPINDDSLLDRHMAVELVERYRSLYLLDLETELSQQWGKAAEEALALSRTEISDSWPVGHYVPASPTTGLYGGHLPSE